MAAPWIRHQAGDGSGSDRVALEERSPTTPSRLGAAPILACWIDPDEAEAVDRRSGGRTWARRPERQERTGNAEDTGGAESGSETARSTDHEPPDGEPEVA